MTDQTEARAEVDETRAAWETLARWTQDDADALAEVGRLIGVDAGTSRTMSIRTAIRKIRAELLRRKTEAVEPPAAAPAVDRAALRTRIADAIRAAACTGDCGQTEEECAKERIQPFVWHHGTMAVVEGSPEQIADAVLAALPDTGHAVECRECNDTGACNGGPCPLRRLADETPDAGCTECPHPQAAHQEGDDPVSPGQCSLCPDDDGWHDYQPAAGARQDGATT